MNTWHKSIWLTVLLLLFTLPAPAAQEDKVSLNFVNADIQEVIKAISQISKKNFLVDPRVKGSINIVSATPVSSELAYDILLSALRLQGYAAVDSDGVTKILPESDAKLYVDAVGKHSGKGDKIVTKVFVLKNESATQMVNVVRPMIAPNNLVIAHASSNALVITDYVSNLRRIEQVIKAIDLPSADSPIIIPVKNSSAMDLANTINKLMPEASSAAANGDGNQRFVLMGDARSNSLLLRADNPGRIARVRELVAKMDNDTGVPGNVHVVTLRNADAAKLAQTLRAVMSGDTSAPGAQSSPTGAGMVQADTSSNSLIITASEPIFKNLRNVIDRLDVRRPQVFVEALIVEVTADKAAEFGVQWQTLTNNSGNRIVGGTNFGATGNIINLATSPAPTIGQGLNIGVVNGSQNVAGVGQVLNLGLLAKALETDSNANILSSPNLLTLDNEEAKIVVGQNVPFITGSYAQTAGSTTATPFQTIERKDVGLTLKIKPQILEGGSVRLQVYQEVSSVVTGAANTSGITTNKRSIESNILVDKDQIVVLGGLIQDSVNDVKSQMPVLGDIPIIGRLFSYESRQRSKTNLMVFIRPYVMRDRNSYEAITHKRYDQMSDEQKNAQLTYNFMLPVEGGPQLPDYKPSLKLDSRMPPSKPAAKTDSEKAK